MNKLISSLRLSAFVAAACLIVITSAAQSALKDEPPKYPEIVTAKPLYAKNDFRGKAAPKLEVGEVLNGALPDTKGKVILIDFWTTWCGPCGVLVPELNKWKKKFGDDIIIIGLSYEPPARVKSFMKKTRMDYLVACDNRIDGMFQQIGVQGMPHIIVISADGIVRWQGVPGDKRDLLTEDVLAQIISANNAAIAKQAIAAFRVGTVRE